MADGQKVTPQELLAMYKKSQATVARLANRNDELTRENAALKQNNSELIDKLSAADNSLKHAAFELKRTAPAQPPIRTPADRVVTTEQTGKEWKLGQLLGCLGAIIAAFVFTVAISMDSTGALPIISLLAGFLCVIGWLAARVGAWWHHG